jgi:S1-C subfamily serine protease
MAMIFGLLVHDFDKAREMYEEALNRDPGNVAILNNLAITEVILRRHSNAIAHFRLAAARSDARQIAKNIERYFNISTDDVPLDSQNRRKLTDLLASVGKSSESDSVSRKVGWQYMLIGALQVPDIDVPGAAPGALITPALTKAEPASAKPQFGMQDVAPVIEEQVVGIIVSPETILVPVNLIVDGATYVVRLSPDRTTTIAATFFAKSEPKGLALLSCPGIESAPLVLSGEAMKSGQECIGVNCSVGAKAGQRETIRGKILAPASDKFLGYCLTTVMLPEGNAGAPIFDLQGRVIGLHNRSYRFTSKLGTAIASRDAIGFLKESMPELQNAKAGDDRKLNSSPEPTKVDFGVLCNGPVVLVSALVPPQNVGLSERVGKEFWHDRSCPVCNGTKVVDCTVRTCNRGSITVMETVRVKDPVAGLVEETVPKQYRCTTCNATGTLPCKKCNQTGLDPNLR